MHWIRRINIWLCCFPLLFGTISWVQFLNFYFERQICCCGSLSLFSSTVLSDTASSCLQWKGSRKTHTVHYLPRTKWHGWKLTTVCKNQCWKCVLKMKNLEFLTGKMRRETYATDYRLAAWSNIKGSLALWPSLQLNDPSPANTKRRNCCLYKTSVQFST